MSRNFLKPLIIALALSGAACGPQPQSSSGQNTVVSGVANIGGPFTLTDHTGKAVTDEDFKGKPLLVYFGFAYCPDVCPTSLQRMGAALSMRGVDADFYQSILITVDPERDTSEKLAQYVTANGFPKNLIGLTGTQEQIDAAKKAYSAVGMKIEDEASAAGYTFGHSDFIYLMDAEGKFLDIFSSADSPQYIADRLIQHKKTGR